MAFSAGTKLGRETLWRRMTAAPGQPRRSGQSRGADRQDRVGLGFWPTHGRDVLGDFLGRAVPPVSSAVSCACAVRQAIQSLDGRRLVAAAPSQPHV